VFEKTKEKAQDALGRLEEIAMSIKSVLWVAVSALATACLALCVALFRRPVMVGA
jgi:hypothetical protein